MDNPSGIEPVEFNVLVLPDKVEEKTAGGLYKPDTIRDREQFAAQRCTIVAVSPMAFNSDVWSEDHDRPAPGDRCLTARHVGANIEGDDGQDYRIVKDSDILAMLKPAPMAGFDVQALQSSMGVKQ